MATGQRRTRSEQQWNEGHPKAFQPEINFRCMTCYSIFNDLSDLKTHERIHTLEDVEKPLSCKYCEKMYSSNEEVKIHELSHIGEKPKDKQGMLNCMSCNKSFARFNDLRRHKKKHGEKQYSCSLCEKSFENFGTFSDHKHCHEKEFTEKTEQNDKIHTEEKPYRCSKCEKRFTNETDLAKHQKTKHCSICTDISSSEHAGDEKPFSCSECDKKFNSQLKVMSY